jgi:Zn-dependent M28 family amino/carboxypeptidase
MGFLASDALRGRGSGTHDELVAATYLASEFEQYGLEPAGDDDGFIQHVTLEKHGQSGRELHTWNVIAKLSGVDPTQQHDAILLTAHLDHLGVRHPVGGDAIYNGADDDASGTTAVLELARALAAQPKPRRTVIFALFGSEEKGARGSIYFRAHPPVPLTDIAAYLEFEMIGRLDPAVPPDTLWLTGWKRTNLGPELAKHGAHLVGDPHPAEDFFRRSDNYVFAKQGVVAQTVSSYGLHPDYHRPSDDLSHIDFKHMADAIESMLNPIIWLANSDFVPHWNEGEKP